MSKKIRVLFVVIFAMLALVFVTSVAKAEEIDGDKDAAPVEQVADDQAPAEGDDQAPADTPTEGEGEGEGEEEAKVEIYVQPVGLPSTAAVGSTISYKIILRNNGDTLANVTVKDELSGQEWFYETLDGNMKMLDGSYTVTEADGEAGSISVVATATTEDGLVFTNTDAVTVTIGEAAPEEETTPTDDQQQGGQQQGGQPGGQQQGGQPGGPQGGVPATGDASMLPMVVSAVSGLVALAGAAVVRRRD